MAELNKNMNNAESNETAPKKAEKTTKSQEKTNVFVKAGKWIAKFLKDTKGEMKKVVWTSKSDVWKSLQLVIIAVVGVSLAIWVVDFLSSTGISALARLFG
jgi:preprotein translocase subunit SecE